MKTIIEQDINTSQEQKQQQRTVQKQKIVYEKDVPTPSNYGVVHNYKCLCNDCRRYYCVEDGEVKEKKRRFVPVDRHKELDCSEYMDNHKINKYREYFMMMRGVEYR
jgi:hypothetical protein